MKAAALLGALGAGIAAAQISSVSVGSPPPPLMYSSFGMCQVNFSYAGTSANSFTVTLSPFDQTETFDAALPTDGRSPWIFDSGNTAATWGVGSGSLSLSVNGVADSTTTRGGAAYLYRKLPMVGSTLVGSLDVAVNCVNMFSTHPNAKCGIVVYHAGRGMHLLTCGLARRANGAVVAEMEGTTGTPLASAAVNEAGGPWGSTAYIRVTRDVTGNSFSCAFASSPTTNLGSMTTTRLSVSTGLLDAFVDGDLWYGMFARAWGGSSGTTAAATFDWARSWMAVPAVPPTDVNGMPDACISTATVAPVSQTITRTGSTSYSVLFTGLSQSFPYTVALAENLGGGITNAYTEFVPLAYARPMPPRPHMLGAWYDARNLQANTPYVAPGSSLLSFWPDSSGNGHTLTSSGARRPQIAYSQYYMKGVTFTRASGTWMQAGADSIDLGGSTEFTMYAHSRLTNSAPSIVAGRGIQQDVRSVGYAVMQYADFYNPWPGYRGWRVTDTQGNMASLGMLNAARWSYIYQGSSMFVSANTGNTAGASVNSLYPHPTKQLSVYRPAEIGQGALDTQNFYGFPGAPQANISTFPAPIGIDWSSGAAVPDITSANNFHVGGPTDPNGDPNRSLDGEVFSLALYREAHTSSATRAAVSDFVDWYQFRRCYGINSPNVQASSSRCAGGYRDDYCYQSCGSGYAQSSGTNDHWCQGGTWSGAPAVCKKQCGTWGTPRFIQSCQKLIMADNFDNAVTSWARFIVYPYGTPDVIRDIMWNVETSTGTMYANTHDDCKRTYATYLGLHPNRWDLIVPYGGLQQANVKLMLRSADAVAGISIHFQSDTYQYVVTISKNAGVSLYRNSITAGNLITTNPNGAANVTVGTWFDMSFSVTNLFNFAAVVSNFTVLQQRDTLAAGPTWGSVAFYADGPVAFRNFSITSSCDSGGACIALSDGQSCSYVCKPGYKTVSTSNNVIGCSAAGSFTGSFMCLSQPPTFTNATYAVYENSPIGTAVGTVKATPANFEQQIDYAIVAQYPLEINGTFTIGSCSGMILVANPDYLVWRLYKNFTVTVRARPDGDPNSAAFMNFTIVNIRVDQPPIFTPSTQAFNVSENLSGVQVGMVSVFDPNDDADTFAIIVGNDARNFVIDNMTGIISTARPLDFESLSVYNLLVAATKIRNRNFIGSGQIVITVIDENDSPQISPALFYIDESQLSTSNLPVGTMSAFDPDNNVDHPNWSQLSFSVATNAFNNSQPLFAIDPTTGAVTLVQRLQYYYSDGSRYINGVKARGQFTATFSVCDAGTPSLCASAAMTMVVVANYSAPLQPVILAYNPSSGFSTQGNEVIQFYGLDFDTTKQVNATYCSTDGKNRCYTVRGCTVDSSTKMTCRTVAGWGTSLAWNFTIGTTIVAKSTEVSIDYAPPRIDKVTILDSDRGFVSTAGGFRVNITGANFGPNDTETLISYGTANEFRMIRLLSSHTMMIAQVLEGCGAGLPVTVTIGGTLISSTTDVTSSSITFPNPTIVGLRAEGADYTLSTLRTIGGQIITLTGTSLGPFSSSPVVTYVGSAQVLYTASCTKSVGTAHTTMTCTTAPGVGANISWSINVCGLVSPPSAVRTAYKPPQITLTSGTGKTAATTEGGQSLSIFGTDLGYDGISSRDELAAVISAVRYGNPSGPYMLAYMALNCSIAPNPTVRLARLDCLTSPGTGANHSLQVVIGGQVSNVLASAMNYAPPTLAAFDWTTMADTRGGQVVLINGSNYGYDINKVTVTYRTIMVDPRAYGNRTVPGNPPGRQVFTASNCSFYIDHRAIQCSYAPGAGRKLSFEVMVDGQASASPTTTYLPPSISDVALLDGATAASTRGGTRIRLRGLNFGTPDLIQAVRYGRNGREYLVDSFVYVDHTEIIATIGPGIGDQLSFTIEVADQISDQSPQTFSYAMPRVVALAPNTDITYRDPQRPTIVTVSGYDFGLLDATADVSIAFGEVTDGTMGGLIPIIARYPTADAVASGQFVPPQGGYLETVSFILPESLGANRSVRVVPYHRGESPSVSDVLRFPVSPAAMFTFIKPQIAQVATTMVGNSLADVAAAHLLFPSATDVSQFRRLVLSAPTAANPPSVDLRSFGPPQSTDLVQRVLEFKQVDISGTISWSTMDVGVSNWTHATIVAYSRVSAATMRVRITSRDASGMPLDQVSNEFPFSELSPRVLGLSGASTGFVTPGGQQIVFSAGGLGSTQLLNVTIGGRTAQLLDAAGNPVSAAEASTRIILPQGASMGYPPFPDSFVWTIRVQIPEGQGTRQYVSLIRDGAPSEDTAGNAIDYAPPTIDSLGIWSATLGIYVHTAWVQGTRFVLPTDPAKLKVEIKGSNLGVCPFMMFNLDTAPRVAACVIANNRLVVNLNVTRTHFLIDFDFPTGEGSRSMLPNGASGWFMHLDVGGQTTPTDVLFTYAAPVVTSISPATGPTSGGFRVTITGDNFGELSTPIVDVGSNTHGWVPCTNVVRTSHQQLSCTVGEGIGRNLQARVQVADLVGTGGTFAYLPPAIDWVTAKYLVSTGTPEMMVPPGYNGTLPVAWRTQTIAYGNGTLLTGDSLGGFHVILSGSNFGPARPAASCALVQWSRYLTDAAVPVCDGLETYLGEGEVPAWKVLSWTHASIVFVMPPGSSTRAFSVSVGGQVAARSIPTGYVSPQPDFMYRQPVLTEPFTMSGPASTEGGDTVSLHGLSLPVDTYRSTGSSGVALPLWLGALNSSLQMLPTQHVVIIFGSKCITSARDEQGRVPPGIDILNCLSTGMVRHSSHRSWYVADGGYGAGAGMDYSSLTNISQWQTDSLSFVTPSGIGVNRTMKVRIYDYSPTTQSMVLVSESAGQNFSYAPPSITYVDPSPLYITSLADSVVMQITGKNIGSYADSLTYTPEDRVLGVTTGGLECNNPSRIVRNGQELVQCTMNTGEITVGFKNTSITAAGQTGTLPETHPRALQIVCGREHYGWPNQTCLRCVQGATCAGFIVGYGADQPNGFIGNVYNDGSGLHTYPVPNEFFYNLNGTQAEACPPAVKIPGRDVCVVGCMPDDACLGNNVCSAPYRSKAPSYRCADCNIGYYRRNSICIRCPESPAALVIGVILLLFFVAGVGWWLQKAKINIAVVSVGIDYFQVLAIFANAKIKWPPEILELFSILSAFNLNIEIVAPECIVPEVSYMNKWSAVMAIPLGVYVITLVIHTCAAMFRWCIMRQDRKVAFGDFGASALSSMVSILTLMYIYLSKTVLDVMTCVPASPDDGQLYMAAGGMEPCGKPGGTQTRLLPWAIAALLIYVLGYPAGLAFGFWRARKLIMMDQILRAKGVGDDPLTAPETLTLRRTFSRSYYAFRPDCYYWALAILLRKLLLVTTFVIFNQVPAFQLAACILILFFAYAAQARYKPYMPVSDFDDAVRDHQLASLVPNSLHAALAARLRDVDTRGRKTARKNFMMAKGHTSRVNRLVAIAFNLNTLELILLFGAILVNLMAIMYSATKADDPGAPRQKISYVIIIVLSLTIAYYLIVLLGEIYLQALQMREEQAIKDGRMRGVSASTLRKQPMTSADVKKAAYDAARASRRFSTKLSFNPMLTSGVADSGDDMAQQRLQILAKDEAPDAGTWLAFKQQFMDLMNSSSQTSKELHENRGTMQRLMDELGVSSPDAMLEAIEALAASGGRPRRVPDAAGGVTKRKVYMPTTAPGSSPDAPGTPGGTFTTNPVAGRPGAAARLTTKRAGRGAGAASVATATADGDGDDVAASPVASAVRPAKAAPARRPSLLATFFGGGGGGRAASAPTPTGVHAAASSPVLSPLASRRSIAPASFSDRAALVSGDRQAAYVVVDGAAADDGGTPTTQVEMTAVPPHARGNRAGRVSVSPRRMSTMPPGGFN